MKNLGKIFRFRGDKAVWAICLLLSGISLVFVYSSIGYTAIAAMHTTPLMAFAKHLVFVLAAYLVAAVTSNLNYQLFSRIASVLYIIALGLLFFTLLMGGRWMRIPLLGQFQPSEVAKIFVVIFTARTLAVNSEKLTDKRLFWLAIVPLALIVAFILPENLSTALLVFGTGLVMMYVGGIKKKYILTTILALMLLGAAGLFTAYKVFHSPLAEYARETILARAETWSNRVDHWLNPDEMESSQENFAKMAVAEGGLFRVNIGGTVHARLMTQANNDFIYSIIIEEMGSIPGIIIFLLYTILYYRCIMLAYWSGRRFGGLLILGLSTSIYLQAIVHMCVCVGVIPVTGQTLPLISTGGTAYIITGFSIGLIQSVARNANESRKQREHKAADAPIPQPTTATTENTPAP